MKKINLHIILFTVAIFNGCASYLDSKPASLAPMTGYVNNRGADNDFDRDAMGAWITTGCYAANKGQMMQRIITVLGHGKMSMTDINYSTGNCSGVSQATQASELDYTIASYANGSGQIIINGQPANIMIKGNQLTWNSARASFQFTKTN